MFKNYWQIAWRNLAKDRLYSSINILGLAIGLVSCLMLALFIKDELSFDRFWPDAGRLHVVHTHFNLPGGEAITQQQTPGPLKETMQRYFSQEIAAVGRMNRQWPVIRAGGEIFEEPMYMVDPEVVDVLGLTAVKGDLQQAINDQTAIALSETLATKYYGSTDVLGEVITFEVWGMKKDLQVKAVYQDLPHNTSIEGLSAMIKIHEPDFDHQQWMLQQWQSTNNTLVLKLNPGVDIAQVEQRLVDMVANNVALPEFIQEQYTEATDWISFSTQPVVDIYLSLPGRQNTLIIFSAIAALILIIACINFTNLSIAKSTRRAKEVALRKVMGASRRQLVVQFISESIFITAIACLLALVMLELAMPAYNAFLERELMIQYSQDNILALVTLILLVGFLGGIYPALVLSGFRPAHVLKANKSAETTGSLRLRNFLVVAQFSISIILIVSSIVMYIQRQYAMSMELGYDAEHIVVLHGVGRAPVDERGELIREQIAALPGMLSASLIELFPATEADWSVPAVQEDGQINLLHYKVVDKNFLPTFGIEMVAGRYFDEAIHRDNLPDFQAMMQDPTLRQGNILINETAVAGYGLGNSAEEALGQDITLQFGDMNVTATIVGVVADANYRTVRQEIQPEAYFFGHNTGFMAVRFTGDPRQAEQTLRQYWQDQVPELPFVRTFVTDLIELDFKDEQKKAQLLAAGSAFAIMVSCLGLFGLASFAADRRIKEIGVRKVMGASVFDIVKLLTWQFSKPVLFACIIGCIGATSLMMHWLRDFPYRIEDWWLLVSCALASVLAVMIAWLTIGGKAARVAQAKPIEALRYE